MLLSVVNCKWSHYIYTEAKVDVTQKIEQRAQWSSPAWAACCALYFLCYIHFSLSVLHSNLLLFVRGWNRIMRMKCDSQLKSDAVVARRMHANLLHQSGVQCTELVTTKYNKHSSCQIQQNTLQSGAFPYSSCFVDQMFGSCGRTNCGELQLLKS